MALRRSLLAPLALLSLAALAGSGPASPPPGGVAATLTWTAARHGQFTWDGAVAAAAAHVEGGFTDWRLPTLTEAQNAMRDGTFGQTDVYNAVITQYTDKSQGQWNTTSRCTTDAAGYPVPATVTSHKVLKSSWLLCKFVRP